ncbi:DUF3105 domain-containing protein [Embleya sp. NPDC055664]
MDQQDRTHPSAADKNKPSEPNRPGNQPGNQPDKYSNKPSKKQSKAERSAKMAETRRRVAAEHDRQRRAQRRRALAVRGLVTLLATGVIAALAIVVSRSNDDANNRADQAGSSDGTLVAEVKSAAGISSPIRGVTTYTASQGHEAKREIRYEQVPPVGGQHDPAWLNCGTYAQPVPARNAVHSLEHGAVWLTYRPDLPADQLAPLTAKAKASYVILSPVPDLPSPVVASAWGIRLPLDDVGDPRLDEFLKTYREGPQSPEPGAPCSGGVSK